jgi:uncharacterized protein YjcR
MESRPDAVENRTMSAETKKNLILNSAAIINERLKKTMTDYEWDVILSPDNAKRQFDEMMVNLTMQMSGCSQKEAERGLANHALRLQEQRFQESLAEVCP